ncbi:MAG: zinc-binding dehydrogenase [Alphaproteobacteria bacterium]
MRALQLLDNRSLTIVDLPAPPPPEPDEVQVRIGVVALNHIDVWGWRGMAFAKRKLPIVIGAEAAGTVTARGAQVQDLREGQIVALYGAETCGHCEACRQGRDNFCENVAGIRGFHVDGLARELVNVKARLCVAPPGELDLERAACAPVTYGTVEHMLFDNADLREGQSVLVQAGGSGIGTAAIQLAKAAGATVITTVGSEAKVEKARALGADHVINYREDRFEGVVRKLTRKRGVDVVFEHVGPDTFAQSMFCMKRGGVLVTCGSTTGIGSEINLYQLYQRQLRLIGSFGCTIANLRSVLAKMVAGIADPVIDATIDLDNIDQALARLESRDVFGKILVRL